MNNLGIGKFCGYTIRDDDFGSNADISRCRVKADSFHSNKLMVKFLIIEKDAHARKSPICESVIKIAYDLTVHWIYLVCEQLKKLEWFQFASPIVWSFLIYFSKKISAGVEPALTIR